VVETVSLLLISVHMAFCMLCKMVELVHILHHSHVSLLQIQKLRQLPIQQTSRNIILTESSGKLLLSHTVVHRLHGIKNVSPCIDRPQKLLCGKVNLLLVNHSEQPNLLLQNTKPMLHVQRLSSWRERGWVCLQEVLVGIGPLNTAGTTPVPAIATEASAGEATNSLCQQLHGTG
jgi:hypothetical protein